MPKCAPLHSFGPAVRPNYIIHLILDGKGIYRVGKQQYELSAGEGVPDPAGDQHLLPGRPE